MAALPLKPRHYPATPGLVRRTQADFTRDQLRSRGVRTALTEPLLDVRPAQPRLVSSAEGALRRLLLAIPDYAVASPPLAAIYGDLCGALGPDVALVILTHEAVAADVRRMLAAAGRNAAGDMVVAAPDHLVFSVWAEDGYCVVTDGEEDTTYLVEPYSFPRYGDGLIAEFVSNATDLRKAQAPLYFQGGNVLIGDDFFFIGADYPAESLAYVGQVLAPAAGESPAALVRRLYGEYLDGGRRLIYVGSTVPVPIERERRVTIDGERWTEVLHAGNDTGTAQPIFHIDMFVTLAGRGPDGRYRVLVGDPALAAQLTGERVQAHAMREVFDSIAAGLSRLGFAVIRNPLPLAYVDDPDARVRFWYFATANNALVQVSEAAGNHVYLPSYGHGGWASLRPVDDRNETIWRDLGFTTHVLGDCHPLAANLGSVHCIKKFLARDR
ncbi:MAG: hypothetical protein ACRD2W_13050 [Acidimicrobiales bacterium]